MYEKHKNNPILLNLFEQYEEDIYTSSTLTKDIRKLQLEISNKLQEKRDIEQNELIEQLKYCMGAETAELLEKAFVYGFCMAETLKEETENYINNNKNNMKL